MDGRSSPFKHVIGVVNPPDRLWNLLGQCLTDHRVPPGTDLSRVSDLGMFSAVLANSGSELHGAIIDIRSPVARRLPPVPVLAWGPNDQLTAAVPSQSKIIRADLPEDLKCRLTAKEEVNRVLRDWGAPLFTPFFTFATGTSVLDEKAFTIDQLADAICWQLSWVSDQEADERSKTDIITSMAPAWDELTRAITANPELLHQISCRKFEQLVAEIFASYGFEVELTAATRDGGYDIIALRRLGPTVTRHLIEAKGWNPNRKVPPARLRELFGTRQIRGASQVILATSSYVSTDARREFLAHMPHELDIIERDKILEWCHAYPDVVDISGEW